LDHFCSSCRTPFANEFALAPDGVCALCRLGVRGFDFAYCYGAYDGHFKDLIHLHKYGRVEGLAAEFTPLLSAALPLENTYDAVVPVPLHWRRYWQRGFNQAAQLANGIARRRGLRLARLLARTRFTSTQTNLSHADRRKNISGAFRVCGKVDGLRILLVDDVMTTGATAGACANVLKTGGGKIGNAPDSCKGRSPAGSAFCQDIQIRSIVDGSNDEIAKASSGAECQL
jgi:ComF family protein